MRDLALPAAVRAHDPEIEVRGPHQVAAQETPVVRGRRVSRRILGAPADPLAVAREIRSTVVAELIGEPHDARAVRMHLVQVEVAVAHGSEHDPATVDRERGLGVVAGRAGEATEVGAVGPRGEDVVALSDRPHVALREVRRRRARVAREVGRGEQHAPIPVVEVAAGGAALASAHPLECAGREVEHELLIAGIAVARGLEDQLGSVARPVGLRRSRRRT